MTINDILKDGKSILLKNKIDNAEFDATQILLSLLDIDMSNLLAEVNEDLEHIYDKSFINDLINKFDRLISFRSQHYPLQYILGEAYFCGMKFAVDENVLIPRFDTETLVEKVLDDNQDKNKSVLDLCTGSGCIAIALANLGGYKNIIASDISIDAIQVASQNAENLVHKVNADDEQDQKVYFLQSDLFDNFEKIIDNTGIDKFDIITCNPPYIRSNDIEDLDIEVKKFEPRIALDGDSDGLKYYKRISKEAKKYLNQNGKIYLEIGYDQANEVKKIFEKEKYQRIEVVKDLSGNDRVLVISYNI